VSEVVQSEKRCVGRLCMLLGRTSQGYYKGRKGRERDALCGELIMQEVLLVRERQRRLGGRKLYYLLEGFLKEHQIEIGRDAFFDLLREYGLLVRTRRARKPRTTFSYWRGKKYPNLAKDMVPTRANQLWVSDITYIRTRKGCGYLSLITDAYSRKIVGFHLSGDLGAGGCARALRMALNNNPEREGLVHHSDRGVQYYSALYMHVLGEDIRISMTENSDPLENAIAERVNGILKQEYLEKKYKNIFEAGRAVQEAVDLYNNERPHSSIAYLTPAEAHDRTGDLKRLWKNYAQYNKAEAFQVTA
jgi:putative transposase